MLVTVGSWKWIVWHPPPGRVAVVAACGCGARGRGCRGGLLPRDRTLPRLAAVVLVPDGPDPADAWHRVATARGSPVPDTAARHDLVNRLPRAP